MPEFDRAYFQDLYAANRDPWRYETSAYEKHKYDATLDVLPRATYRQGLELGCSIGVLTERLSRICEQLTAVDTSSRALDEARRRCPSEVHFVQAHLPDGDWSGCYDLVVASEVLYFLELPAIAVLGARLSRLMSSGAHLLLVHWTGSTNYPLSADQATRAMRDAIPSSVVHEQREAEYRLDLWQFTGGRPAAEEVDSARTPGETTR